MATHARIDPGAGDAWVVTSVPGQIAHLTGPQFSVGQVVPLAPGVDGVGLSGGDAEFVSQCVVVIDSSGTLTAFDGANLLITKNKYALNATPVSVSASSLGGGGGGVGTVWVTTRNPNQLLGFDFDATVCKLLPATVTGPTPKVVVDFKDRQPMDNGLAVASGGGGVACPQDNPDCTGSAATLVHVLLAK